MDKDPFVSRLNKQFRGAILEFREFGRSKLPSVWVEAQAILKVAQFLKQDPILQVDLVENLSVMEIDDALVVTYFLSSSVTRQSYVVRISTVPLAPEAEVRFSSLASIWPTAKVWEEVNAPLFGIRFLPTIDDTIDDRPAALSTRKLDAQKDFAFSVGSFAGFPQRRAFQMPSSQNRIERVKESLKSSSELNEPTGAIHGS